MKCTRFSRSSVVPAIVLIVGCSDPVSAPSAPVPLVRATAITGVTAIDLSNGAGLEGSATILSNTGIIVGWSPGTGRFWWQAPSPQATQIDAGSTSNGNRLADVAAQDHVLLSTDGGAPWTRVDVQRPGTGSVYVRHLNESRVMVGHTLGSEPVQGLHWGSPTDAPTVLVNPATDFTIRQTLPHALNNAGVIAGYVYGSVGRRDRREAVVWIGGVPQILPLAPGAVQQIASNVNDAGVVAGYINTGSVSYPARWTPNPSGGYDVVVLDLPSPGNVSVGINSCGQISGGSNSGAFVWDPVTGVTILPGLTGVSSVEDYAHELDDNGNVVGTSYAGKSKGKAVKRPTLWTGLSGCAGTSATVQLSAGASETSTDADGDDIFDDVDNCPGASNADQRDSDGDGMGDACDAAPLDPENDADGDGIPGDVDNCRYQANADQADSDGDGAGDVCDVDNDNDAVENEVDNCPRTSNPFQQDLDRDGVGDACDDDVDGDGVDNAVDNCKAFNPDQLDTDGDGIGDVCDADDTDRDGVIDVKDNCPTISNADQADKDNDAIGDKCDKFPDDPANDADGDGIPGSKDNCPVIGNADQKDSDSDGIGDACDTVSVQELLDQMSRQVSGWAASGTLNRGIANSLTVKLAHVAASMAAGDPTTARNQLTAFVNEVQALRDAGRLGPKEASSLEGQAHEVRALIA